MTLAELNYVRKHLARWMRDRKAATPLAQFHAKSFTVAEPYGVVLIMSPWNYPFMLTLEPLIGAIAAGNCCVVKPSPTPPPPPTSSAPSWRSAFPRNSSVW